MIAGLRYLLALVGEVRYALRVYDRNAALRVELHQAREQVQDALAAFGLAELSGNAARRALEHQHNEVVALRRRVAELEPRS